METCLLGKVEKYSCKDSDRKKDIKNAEKIQNYGSRFSLKLYFFLKYKYSVKIIIVKSLVSILLVDLPPL